MQGVARSSSTCQRALVRAVLALMAVMAVVIGLVPHEIAAAAGPAVVSVDVTVVDSTTGLPVTIVDPVTMPNYRLNVAYSCNIADCSGVKVAIPPAALDPYYGASRLTTTGSFIPPFTPAPAVVADGVGGYTVNLGTVTAGTSGTFSYTFAIRQQTANTPSNGSFFPNGYQIVREATISATNADNTATDSASASWSSIVPNPTTAMLMPTNTRTDTEISVTLRDSNGVATHSGCVFWDWTTAFYRGDEQWLCAESYRTVVQLPPNAQYVAGSANALGTYDAATHSVVFEDNGRDSAWGPLRWGTTVPGFRVTFPSGAYPTTGEACAADEDFVVTNDITYLDGTQKSATPLTKSIEVQNCAPFGKATFGGKNVTRSAGTANDPIIYIPNAAQADYSGYWAVEVGNQANVDGVGTITDDTLDQPNMPVVSIAVVFGGPATIQYRLDNGFTGTATIAQGGSLAIDSLGQGTFAATGRRFVAVTATSAALRGPNTTSAGTAYTPFQVRFGFRVPSTATPGMRTNSATSAISYPDYPQLVNIPFAPDTQTVSLQPTPATPPRLTAATGGPATDGNVIPLVGMEVRWTLREDITNAPNNDDIVPQYVFVAPEFWDITGFTFNTEPPAGYTQTYKTVVIAGKTRNAILVTWPEPVSVPASGSLSLPTMTIKTKPTGAAPAGTNNHTAGFYVGDAADGTATYATAYTDATDIDGDGVTTDIFSSAERNASLAPTRSIGVTKEICRPDASEADGCDWLSDASVMVGVPPSASSIKYRVTMRNTGNAALTNVFAYDVLPYPGDVGTTNATVANPRGSTVKEVVSAVSNVGAGVALNYSNSTNPSRPQVYSGSTDPADWDTTPSGASSIRAQIANLPAFASRSFTYEAALVDSGADEVACNSVAVNADTLVAIEPAPVCATTQEADFAVDVANRFPLQEGRVGTVPFVVTNLGGSAVASGTVTITVPEGVTTVGLGTVNGWNCSAASMTGPVDVACIPVKPDGSVRSLARDAPETIALKVRPTETTGEPVCFGGTVEGLMFDPNLENNDDNGCSTVFSSDVALDVHKFDGVTVARPGQLLTYTITLTNRLVAEGLTAAALIDRLPANVVFVSASDSGVLSGADGDGRGGVVRWPTVNLAAAGSATPAGSDGTGAAGSSVTRTVTVRVVARATGRIVNTAEATAADPALASATFTDADTDTDELQRSSLSKASNAPAAGVRDGDVVTYTLTLENDGTAAYTAGDPAMLVDDLAAILDDAVFVAGSATARINGEPATGIPDPGGDRLLRWSGPLAVGSRLEVSYQVTVGDGASGDRVLTNTVFAASEPGTCAGGLDVNGISCASLTISFAPVLAKTVRSLDQNDDGTWTIVYDVFVTNLNPTQSATYEVSDELRFGAGIDVIDASITSAPPGVTPQAWSGSGTVATDVTIPGDGQHTYELTVVANPNQTPGTPASRCLTGLAGGFANESTITLTDNRTTTAEACAAPTAPQVTKTAAPSSQLPDGTWSTVYTVTVRNPNREPATLSYTLDDVLTVPAGITVNDVTVTGPPGAPMNAGFDGAGDTALLTGADRIDAASSTTPATRAYTITLVTDAPAGVAGPSEVACPAAGTGGYANLVTLYAGTSTTELDDASACASAPLQPMPVIAKRVVSSSIDTDGIWTISYEIEVRNPHATYSTRYTLNDQLQFAEGVSVANAAVTSDDTSPSGGWDGQTNTEIVTNHALPAGTTHRYTVTVAADPGALDPESAAADCRIDAGESGTGYRNIATITSGALSAFADACEPITDPSVVKTKFGEPTQDPETGEWTLSYHVNVTNRSTTTSGTIPYTLTDELGFPADIQILDVETTAPDGGETNPDFDGVTQTELGVGAIGAAADENTPVVQVFTVTVRFAIPAGLDEVDPCDVQQGPGGLRNEAEIAVGERVSGSVACAEVPLVPVPGLTKTVLGQEQLADGTWRVLYRITVANPSEAVASTYTLSDHFELGEGIVNAEAPIVVEHPSDVTVNPDWDGEDTTTFAEGIVLPGGGSHTYTIRAILDSGDVRGTDPAGNCTLDDGEEGTGFGNTASLDTGVVSRDGSACVTGFDPPVTKEVNGEPVQQTDGSWLVSYTMTVTNPSATVALRYGLVDELDFPDGTTITVESAAGRAGSPAVEADWDGQAQTMLVADGTLLEADAVHVFDVTVRAVLPDDQESTQGGWANLARVASGVDGVVVTEATAAANIELPELTVGKGVTADPILRIGDEVEYELTIANVGAGDYTDLYPAVVWDDMTEVLDDGELVGEPVVDPAFGEITMADGGFSWRGSLPSEGQITITYTVTVNGEGDADLYNVAFAAAPTDENPETPTEEGCGEDPTCALTASAMPTLAIEKTVSDETALPGDIVDYTVEVTNTGSVALTEADPASIADDLSAVLDNATYQGDASADAGIVTVSGTSLTWSGPLAVGATATINYSVKVDDAGRAGATLENIAAIDGTLAVLSAEGDAIDRAVETSTLIEAAPPAADPPAADPPAAEPTPGGKLPATGFIGADLVKLAAGLMLAGGGLLIVSRRRRSDGSTGRNPTA